MINSIFRKLLYKKVQKNYINDFIIPIKTRKEFEERTVQFLKVAEKHNFYFKQLKYNFDAEEISILGVVVGQKEVQMENDKVKAIKK